jgi:arylsulfatase A-like enzyme
MLEEVTAVRESAHFLENTYQKQRGIRTRELKLKRCFTRGDRELYDLRADPGEQRNLAAERADTADELEARMNAWVAGRLAAWGRAEDPLLAQEATSAALSG